MHISWQLVTQHAFHDLQHFVKLCTRDAGRNIQTWMYKPQTENWCHTAVQSSQWQIEVNSKAPGHLDGRATKIHKQQAAYYGYKPVKVKNPWNDSSSTMMNCSWNFRSITHFFDLIIVCGRNLDGCCLFITHIYMKLLLSKWMSKKERELFLGSQS